MKQQLLFLTVILLVACAFFLPQALRGGILFPLDILHNQLPFLSTVPEILRNIKNPHLSDLVTIYYPWLSFSSETEGPLALWNPYSFLGSPLLANAQNGILFPPNWLYFALPFGAASIVVAIAKMAFAGAFTFLFYRRLGLHEQASLLGALAYMLGGHFIAWFGYPTAYPLVALPFVFWALEGICSTRPLTHLPWACLAYGLLMVGGQPQSSFLIAVASLLYFILRARPRFYPLLPLALLVGFCLAAPQLLPFLEYLNESAAGHLRGSLGWKDYPWYSVASWMNPRFFGDPSHDNFWGFSSVMGEAMYFGSIPLCFVTVGLGRKWSRPMCGILAVLAFGLVGLYLPSLRKPYLMVPLLANIDNNKLVTLVSFGLISFAALGFDRFVNGSDGRRVYVSWHLSVAAWTVVVGAALMQFRSAIRVLGLTRFEGAELLLHGVFLFCAMVLLRLWRTGRWSAQRAGSGLILLTTLDLFRVWGSYYPSYPAAYAKPRSTSLEFLKRNIGLARFYGLDAELPPEISLLYRIPDARGYDGLTPLRYYRVLGEIDPGVHDLIERFARNPPAAGAWRSDTLFRRSLQPVLTSADPKVVAALRRLDYWSNDITRITRPHLLSVLGIRFILAAPNSALPRSLGFELVHSSDAEVWENKDALPRAFIATHPVLTANDADALEQIADPGFPFQRTALVFVAGDSARGTGALSDDARIEPVSIVQYSPRSVELTTESSSGGWLVLCDLFYPGWEARVDGKPTPIMPANYVFRAVELPAGKHVVSFRYRPPSFYRGVQLCLAAIVLIGAWIVYCRLRPESVAL